MWYEFVCSRRPEFKCPARLFLTRRKDDIKYTVMRLNKHKHKTLDAVQCTKLYGSVLSTFRERLKEFDKIHEVNRAANMSKGSTASRSSAPPSSYSTASNPTCSEEQSIPPTPAGAETPPTPPMRSSRSGSSASTQTTNPSGDDPTTQHIATTSTAESDTPLSVPSQSRETRIHRTMNTGR